MSTTENENSTPPPVAARLSFWDTVSIIVGIVVGTAIFRSSTAVFQSVSGPVMALAVWTLGGLVSWCGAVCYAELATTYPRDGGDYEYLNRAFGRWCGFLFGWAQLTTVVSGNIGIMAYAFADYAVRLWPRLQVFSVWLAIAPILLLSLTNALGVVAGKATQNLLSILKVAGLAGVVLAGLWAATLPAAPTPTLPANAESNFGLAMVFVLYAFGGWSHAAYVAAEVRNERSSLPRALVIGICCITVIYLAVTAAYLAALGLDGARATATPAADVLERAVGPWGGRAISLLVMLSALGAINGMILTATRIYATLGADYPALAWLANWDRRHAAPVAAIAAQAVVATLVMLAVGTETGRRFCDAALGTVGLAPLPWKKFFGGFETLVAGSAPVFWGFFLLTGLSVFLLRRQSALPRPFSIPLFPLPPIVFCAASAYMLYASLSYARWLSLLGFLPLALGIGVWACIRPRTGSDLDHKDL
ncbi:MAG: APC family permease [Pirellulales bacterium]